jgi:hypothetical protein
MFSEGLQPVCVCVFGLRVKKNHRFHVCILCTDVLDSLSHSRISF